MIAISIPWTQILVLIPVLLLCILLLVPKPGRKTHPGKSVPAVSSLGWVPLLGHSLPFAWNMSAFLRRCEAKYGPIFSIQLFRSNFIILTSREFAPDFFAGRESSLSFYAIFERLYFYEVYPCRTLQFQDMTQIIIRSTLAKAGARMATVRAQLGEEVENFEKKLHPLSGQSLDFREEMRHFVLNSGSSIFLGSRLSPECVTKMIKFFKLFNTVIAATHFIPRFILRAVFHRRLSKLRDDAASEFFPEIQKYRKNPEKNESHIIRTAVSFTNPETGEALTDLEIGWILVIFFHILTENTSLAFSSVLADLFSHPSAWKKGVEQANKFYNQDSVAMEIEGVLSSKYLHGCIMESARLNSEAFAVSRQPARDAVISGYWVGNADIVTLAVGLLHGQGAAGRELFADAETFNPDRFSDGEPSGPNAILTWGAGHHYCVGKWLALAQIKVALTTVLSTVKVEEFQVRIRKGFVSPGVFIETDVTAVFNGTTQKIK